MTPKYIVAALLLLALPAAAQAPDPFQAHVNAAQTAARAGLPAQAAREYRAALRLHPADADAEYALGGVLEQAGRKVEAIAAYRETIRLRPDHAPAHNALAALLEDAGETAAALAQYRQAVTLEPDNALLHFNLGAALADAGQSAAARTEYRMALRLKPDFPEAQAALRAMPPAPALPPAPPPTTSSPKLPPGKRPPTTLAQALALETAGRLPEAITAFHALLAQDPRRADVRLHLGIALYADGQTAAARREWQQIVRGNDPGTAAQARRLLAGCP